MSSKQRRSTRSGIAAGTAIIAASLLIAVAGCSNEDGGVVTTPLSASADPLVILSVQRPVPAGLFVSHLCAFEVQNVPVFDLVVQAVQQVTVDHMLIQMLDGTHVGGPAIPIPGATLATQFGPMVIAGGTKRIFTFEPPLACGDTRPGGVAVAVTARNATGVGQTVTVQSPVGW